MAVTRASYPIALAMPTIPNAPVIDESRAPNTIGRSWIQTQLAGLAGRYAPSFTAARENARANLSGYGGVNFANDDPNTPQDESLLISFDSNAPLGQRERNAVAGERDAANSRGLMSSSFANRSIGNALTRLSAEKQAIVSNFAGQIGGLLNQQATEATGLVTDWTRLFGEDSRWLVDNPPPVAPVVPPPAAAPTSFDLHPGNPEGPNYQNPARPSAPAVRSMTYSDFLRGRPSTRALAVQWNRDFNFSRNPRLL